MKKTKKTAAKKTAKKAPAKKTAAKKTAAKRSTARAKAPKKITMLPMKELWDAEGKIAAQRAKFMTTKEIDALLKKEDLLVAVAILGNPPVWLGPDEVAPAWKTELKPHTCNKHDEGCSLDEFEGEYFYFASYWEGKEPVLLFEMYH